MFGDEKHDSWKWMPYIILGAALLFLFFDPLNMEGTKIKYFVDVAPTPVPTLIPAAGGLPPVANPPVANPAVGNPVGAAGFPSAIDTGPQTPPTKTWPQAGNGTWIVVTTDADGFIFNGCVKTGAPNIRITNSEIRGNCATSQLWDEAGNGSFEYNNIFDVAHGGSSTIGCGTNSRFFRNNIKGAAVGAYGETGCQIIENYIHDLDEFTYNGGGATSNTGVHIDDAGTTNVMIQKNTFENTCGKSGLAGQGCTGVIFINNGSAGSTVDNNYIKKWDGPTAGFIFHTSAAGVNTIKDNVVECANITGYGVTSGGPSIFTNNTQCP